MDLIEPGRAAAQRAARAPLCAEGAAVHRADDGEIAGGHHVLSLPPPARAQRGRRRSRRQSAFRRCLSRRRCRRARSEWPHGMTATATHDTKRGEDARARIMALAEIPGEWASAVARWKVLNAPHLVDRRRHARAVGDLRIHAVSGAARRLAAGRRRSIPRADAGLCAESGARGQAGNQLAQSPRRPTRRDCKTFIARILDRAISAEFLDSLETLAQRVVAAGRAEFAEPDHAEGDDAGRAGFLSGHRVLGSFAGRSRQPPAGGFCRARATALAALETPDWAELAQNGAMAI